MNGERLASVLRPVADPPPGIPEIQFSARTPGGWVAGVMRRIMEEEEEDYGL